MCDFTPFVAGSRMTRTNQEPVRRDGTGAQGSEQGDREEEEARRVEGLCVPAAGGGATRGGTALLPVPWNPTYYGRWIRKYKEGFILTNSNANIAYGAIQQTNKQPRPPPRQLARPPYDGLFAIRLITFHIKAILYSGSLKECCAGTTRERNSSILVVPVVFGWSCELPSLPDVEKEAAPIKRAVHEGEGTRLVITSGSSLQTRRTRRNEPNQPTERWETSAPSSTSDRRNCNRATTYNKRTHSPPPPPCTVCCPVSPARHCGHYSLLFHLIQYLDAWRWSKKKSKTQTDKHTYTIS